jgi:two-component system chemotaxis response regulator CheB
VSRIRVLVVDDSAVARAIMAQVVNAQPDMMVAGLASDPILAMDRLRTSNPDVITLDVEMPRMDGLEFLGNLMRVNPLPVVMVSSLTARGAEVTMRALELGAVDFIAKPAFSEVPGLDAYAEQVADKIRAAAAARVRQRTGEAATGPAASHRPRPPMRTASGARVVTIGASTGGVEALREVLKPLPEDMPPILIAQHMPPGFTRSFAQRLDSLCALRVKEAEDGEPLQRGHAYIAPGGLHMLLASRSGRLETRLNDEPPINRHRPSVDALFRSVAKHAGARAIGVMLSGMGADGAEAMLELRRAGAWNIVQDEASCVVFGMPKQAIAAGAVHEVLPLRELSQRLSELVMQQAADAAAQ